MDNADVSLVGKARNVNYGIMNAKCRTAMAKELVLMGNVFAPRATQGNIASKVRTDCQSLAYRCLFLL